MKLEGLESTKKSTIKGTFLLKKWFFATKRWSVTLYTINVQVPVSMGMRHEQKIPFRGMADEMPDGEPGDMIVILQQLDHPDYRRDGCDLFVEKHISLREALCGFTCVLDTLDGRKLRLSTPAGVVLSPGTCVDILCMNGHS